jgi:hypothetical protein
MPANDR